MTHYRSFAEQAMRYFFRANEGVPQGPVNHPANWLGPDVSQTPDLWLEPLSEAEIGEIEIAAKGFADAGVDMREVNRENFPLPMLEQRIAGWRDILSNGRGFVCLRGLPVKRWREETGDDGFAAIAYWGLGHHLGTPGAQNPQDELLGHVVDYGEEADNPNVRRYRTTGNIDFHCDAADVVGLLCLRTAREGGQSRIASSVAIYNRVAEQRPDLAALLFEPFKLDRRGEEAEGEAPTVDMVPCAYAGGRLSTFWHSEYFRSAPRHDGVADYSDAQMALLDLYDSLAASPEVHLDMWLEPGDMQLISNHVTVHARTGYQDWPEPEKRRHLLRLWLSLD